MATLSDFVPNARLREHDDVSTPATADRALELARHFDLARSPVVHALFWLRTIPERLASSEVKPAPDLRIDAIGRTGAGFMVLEDSRERRLVGAIGRFWESDIQFARVEPAAFAKFAEPGWAKVAWELTAEATENGSRLSIDLAVSATDAAAWTNFERYFRWIGPFSRFIRRHELKLIAHDLGGAIETGASRFTRDDLTEGALGAAGIVYDLATPFWREARCHWGLTEEEAQRVYPGDALVPTPRWQWSHAIEIAARPEDVWPWVAQLGQDKAGFYSYQALENFAGCEIHNADRVHPEWQAPKPGDALRLHPKMPPLEIREVVPQQHMLVCAGLDPQTGVAPRGNEGERFVAVTWLFQLERLAGERTRLVSRYRCACSGDLATRLAYGPYIAEAVGFVMDRRMLIGIAERVMRAKRSVATGAHPS